MADPKQGMQTQLRNIEARTGRSLAQLFTVLKKSGLEKHGELLEHAKREVGLGHGDANALVKAYRARGAPEPSLDAIYSGSRAALRPLHERVMAAIAKLGAFEIAPKKTYLSLRRAKQFAMVGPGTKARLEVGLNMKGVRGTARLEALAPGGMCQYRVFVSTPAEVDAELTGWLRRAYESAGS